VRTGSITARLFVIAAALAGSTVAYGQPSVATLRVDYSAEAGCPTEADFRARIGARLRRRVEKADAASAYAVKVEKRDHRFIGRLGVRAADGSASDREVEGDTCDDVVAALAVVTALAIDAQAAAVPAVEAPLRQEPPTPAAPSALASASAAAAVPPPGGGARVRPPAIPEDAAARLTLGAQLLYGDLMGPPSFGARVFAEPPIDATDLGVGPLRIDADLEVSSDLPAAGGSASLLRAALAVDGCLLGVAVGVLRLASCVRIEGGLLEANSKGTSPARSARRGWLALALPVRGRMPLWGPLVLDAEFGPRMPLLRDGILSAGEILVARPPPIEGVLALGLGWTIL
jgi:hypothetical protein